ncbi:MAG: hypothetical protein IKD72_07225 [Clostridia bacterium]|nr:hypothetical protein [Clostridia bacterium]
MKFTLKQILFGLVGLASTVLSIVCFTLYTGSSQRDITYGGDAYTGIQNAAAQAANNAMYAAEIMKFGFGCVLLIAGLTLILYAVFLKEASAAAPALQSLANDPLYGAAARTALNNPPAPAAAPAVPPYAPPAGTLAEEAAPENAPKDPE